jgi:hypothetical protein
MVLVQQKLAGGCSEAHEKNAHYLYAIQELWNTGLAAHTQSVRGF